MNNFYNQNILIVGGVKGLSRAIAYELCKKQANIFIVDNHRENITEIEREIGNARGTAYGYLCDFSSRKSIESVFNEIIKKHDRIDMLINGVFYPIEKSFIQMTNAEIEEIISIDMITSIYLSRLTLAEMLKQGKGYIVNVLAEQTDDGILSSICAAGINAFHNGINNIMKISKGPIKSISISGRFTSPVQDALKIISAIEKGKSDIKIK